MFRETQPKQSSLEEALLHTSEQTLKAVEKSRARMVGDYIYPNVDEKKFAALYSERGSRPNIPIRQYVSALVLKRMYVLSDEIFLEFLRCGAKNFQYALHTTQEETQPLSENSLGRFRKKVELYNAAHGCDLIKEEFQAISQKLAINMGVLRMDPSGGEGEEQAILARMDSMEIEAHAKAMGRIEIFYTTIVIMLRWTLKKGFGSIIPAGLTHYMEAGDKNRIVYHRHQEDKAEKRPDSRLEQLLEEMLSLKGVLEGNLSQEILTQVPEYQVYQRVLEEQTVQDSEGKRTLRDKKDISPNSVQNPFDTTMTYRYKGGPNHGFVMNVVEYIDGEGNGIITHADVEANTVSDESLGEAYIAQQPEDGPKQAVSADGAFSSEKLQEMAKAKGIELQNTALTGAEPYDIDADFTLDEEGKSILRCPKGKIPESNKYNPKSGQITATMPENCCATCPHKEECNTRFNKKGTVSKVVLTRKMVNRAKQARSFSTAEGKANARRRNGVEGIMSVMRRKYGIDHLPVFGLERIRNWIWTTLLAYNLVKYWKYINRKKSVSVA